MQAKLSVYTGEIPKKEADGPNPNLYLAAFYVLQFSASAFMAKK